MKKLLKEFKDFAVKGNAVNLAIGVIIGAAFQDIIKSLVRDIITPIIGMFGSVDFSEYAFKIGNASIKYGSFITAIINFIIMAFVIFIMVKGMNKLGDLGKKEEAVSVKTCPFCKSEISLDATRCPNCTSDLTK
ncbi:MAG: large conductance mechanosensitive channel protein MscL [Oscillospiraceae bacterium]